MSDPFQSLEGAIQATEERARFLRTLQRRLKSARASIRRTKLPFKQCVCSIEAQFVSLSWQRKVDGMTYYVSIHVALRKTTWVWGKAAGVESDSNVHECKAQKCVPKALIEFVQDHPVLTHEVANAS